MNPGGDFGKRELSPALRNRFTEIYVPAIDLREDLVSLILFLIIYYEFCLHCSLYIFDKEVSLILKKINYSYDSSV
jgi:hypothetical protein